MSAHQERLRKEGKIKTMLLRLDPELHAALKQYSAADNRSMHNQVLHLIQRAVIEFRVGPLIVHQFKRVSQ